MNLLLKSKIISNFVFAFFVLFGTAKLSCSEAKPDLSSFLSLSKSEQLAILDICKKLNTEEANQKNHTKKFISKAIIISAIAVCTAIIAALIYYKIKQVRQQQNDLIKEAGENIGKALLEVCVPKSSEPGWKERQALATIQHNLEQLGPNPPPVSYTEQAWHGTVNKGIRWGLSDNPPLAHLLTDPAAAIQNDDPGEWVAVLQKKLTK